MVSTHWWIVVAAGGGLLAGLAFFGIPAAIAYFCQLDDEGDQPDAEGDELDDGRGFCAGLLTGLAFFGNPAAIA